MIRVSEGEEPLPSGVAEAVTDALLVECGKPSGALRRHALSALATALDALALDRFPRVHDLVRLLLSQVPLFADSFVPNLLY